MRGFGVIEVLLVGGLVAGGAMAMNYLSGVKKSGKKEAVLEMHEAQAEKRSIVSGQLKKHQVRKRKIGMEEEKMIKKGVTEKELNKEAFKRWGK